MTNSIISKYRVNITVVLLRDAYRKHQWLRDSNRGTIVRCIAYRCRVYLCLRCYTTQTESQSDTGAIAAL